MSSRFVTPTGSDALGAQALVGGKGETCDAEVGVAACGGPRGGAAGRDGGVHDRGLGAGGDVAHDALELLLLADIQAAADRLSDILDDRIGLLRKQSSAAWCGWPQIYRHGQRDDARRDVEELDAESDRLARWYGALIAVAGACDDVLADRVPA